MQIAIIHVVIQAAMSAVMTQKGEDTGPSIGTNMANRGKVHRTRYGRQGLRQAVFDLKAPSKYVELLHFEIEVTIIVQTRVYKLNDEENCPVIKCWLGREGL